MLLEQEVECLVGELHLKLVVNSVLAAVNNEVVLVSAGDLAQLASHGCRLDHWSGLDAWSSFLLETS
jgi:hypothetical protein